MSCFHPITGYRTDQGDIKFSEHSGGRPLNLPCGQCIGCRLDRSREWATRITHEAQMHDDNCFITLTYDDDNLPSDGSLVKRDFQLFMKSLRKRIYPKKVRFYHCGEYGDRNNRPHYHAVLFGYNFPDWMYLFDSPAGNAIYTSPLLEEIWSKGFVTIGTVTFESAGYVARYCVKKINGKLAEQINPETGLRPYERLDRHTGDIVQVLPEYATMSRCPGIGRSWIDKYRSDVYPKGFTTVRGYRVSPPRYYDKYLQSIDLEMYDDIKARRNLAAYESTENLPARLPAREKVKKAQNNQLYRSL